MKMGTFGTSNGNPVVQASIITESIEVSIKEIPDLKLPKLNVNGALTV